MALTKLRTAVNKEHDCAECKGKVAKGQKYWDTNDKLNPPKPFPTIKYCQSCGDKKKAAEVEIKK